MDSNKLNMSEDEYYQKIADDHHEHVKKIEALIDLCNLRLLDNKIVVIDSLNLFASSQEQFDFISKIEDLEEKEDSVNYRMRIHVNEDKDNEIIVLTPLILIPNDSYSSISSYIITGLAEFIEKVIYIEEHNHYKTFYRGHGNWEYELVPGIYREDNRHILDNESDYIRDIISSHPVFFENCNSALDYLAVLQHHAFPTRLLDFSENPLIALYMACSSDNEKHSDVIRINVPIRNFKYYDSDTVSVLSNIAFIDDSFSIKDFECSADDDSLEKFNRNYEIQKLVHLIRNEKPYFKAEINPEHLNETIVFVKPKQEFARITHQKGLFALFGINQVKNSMPKIEFMVPACNIKHFIIPSKYKKIILEELSKININEATVFCDMDHIVNYYKTKSSRNEIENLIHKRTEEVLNLI